MVKVNRKGTQSPCFVCAGDAWLLLESGYLLRLLLIFINGRMMMRKRFLFGVLFQNKEKLLLSGISIIIDADTRSMFLY